MNHTRIFLTVLLLTTVVALTFATPARAFDGRSGDRVIVESSEVVDDDLYVGATEFILDGTVNGDVIAFAQTVTVNGTVNGDLFAAGQTVIVNGTITGAIRMAGSVLFVGESASITKDIVSAGYSLEVRKGSAIGRDLIFAGGQMLMAGDVTRDVQTATSAFELRGTVGRNVKAELGTTNPAQMGPSPTMFMPQSAISAPALRPGLKIEPAAKVKGNLEYTQDTKLTLPAGIVSGKVLYTAFVPTVTGTQEPTFAQKVSRWALTFLRSSITHILVGLLLLWLFPTFVKRLSENLRTRFWPSLGWGAVSWVVFIVALVLVVLATIAGGILFGTLTLGQLTGTFVWLGILALFVLIIGFVLTTSFVAEVVFGMTLGSWILTRAHSSLAENRYWPMVIGVLITLAVVALLSFPVIPGFFAWLVNAAVILFGLGALWIWGRDRLVKKPI
jgi:cytoskeletal protein CcmA (bactofilin family)